MKLRSAILAGAAIAACAWIAPAPAQAWELVGSKTVSAGIDRDVVSVRGNERHRQIKICVSVRPVLFRDLDVYFANGGHQDVKVRLVIGPGQCTRNIDLKGAKRNVARITMAYEKILPGHQPVVTVFAQ